jgi:branched-subunit amino acid transport protein AzlD
MKLSLASAVVLTLAMGAVILFCRAFPFIFFRGDDGKGEKGTARNRDAGAPGRREGFLDFVEKTVPPAAMTVLAFNAVAGSLFAPDSFASWENLGGGLYRGLPCLLAAAVTAALHLGKRNPLLSILGGTAFYVILSGLW